MLRLIKNSPKAQYRTLNPRRNLMMPTNVAQQKKNLVAQNFIFYRKAHYHLSQ